MIPHTKYFNITIQYNIFILIDITIFIFSALYIFPYYTHSYLYNFVFLNFSKMRKNSRHDHHRVFDRLKILKTLN